MFIKRSAQWAYDPHTHILIHEWKTVWWNIDFRIMHSIESKIVIIKNCTFFLSINFGDRRNSQFEFIWTASSIFFATRVMALFCKWIPLICFFFYYFSLCRVFSREITLKKKKERKNEEKTKQYAECKSKIKTHGVGQVRTLACHLKYVIDDEPSQNRCDIINLVVRAEIKQKRCVF